MKRIFKKILDEFEKPEVALLQILNYIQDEKGFIGDEDVELISHLLEIPEGEIESVISFYHFLHREKKGKYRIYVCTNIPCLLKGAEEIIDEIKAFLGIELGETTPNGLFSLLETECIGQCDSAPAIIINNRVYKNLTRKKIINILEKLRKNEKG